MKSLCLLAEVPENGALGMEPVADGQDTIFLIRRGRQVYAYRDSCPHWPGAHMAWKRHQYLDVEAKHIVCHGHGALFEIETGLCISGPCLGQNLVTVPVEVTDADVIKLTKTSEETS